MHNRNYSFCKYYRNSKRFDNFSFKSKYSFLAKFSSYSNKFNKLKTHTWKNTKSVYDAASELCNEVLGIYFDEYYDVSEAEGKK